MASNSWFDPGRSLPSIFTALIVLGMTAGCSDSSTEPLEGVALTASMTGERETDFQGSASFRLDEGVFEMWGEGVDIFVGQEMRFRATAEGMLEPGTYSVGQVTEDDEPDLVGTWRMAVAVFTTTEGTFTVSSVSDDEVEGTFSFDAIRTHVCTSLGDCQTLSGEQPVNQVEGSFTATRDDT